MPEADVGYEYKDGVHVPPNDSRPPISRAVFQDYLRDCDPTCLKAIFPLHKCTVPSVERRIWHSVPKKRTFWQVAAASDDKDIAWGLTFTYHVCALRVLVYHVLMLAGAFVFLGLVSSTISRPDANRGCASHGHEYSCICILGRFSGLENGVNDTNQIMREGSNDNQCGQSERMIQASHFLPSNRMHLFRIIMCMSSCPHVLGCKACLP